MTESNDRNVTVPIVEEVATISTREVETGRLRVQTRVEESTHEVTAQLRHGAVEIERRAVEREVASAPAPYEEGEMLIIPITEERAVVEKRLFVVEEIVVRRAARTEQARVPVTLRKMHAVVERDGQV